VGASVGKIAYHASHANGPLQQKMVQLQADTWNAIVDMM
jgi:hypothetical protein